MKGDKNMILSASTSLQAVPAPSALPHKRPGRKKRLFSPDWDPKSGRMGWFTGYCSCGCGGKAILPWEAMVELKVELSRTKKSLTYRLLTRLLKHYEH